jgi:hypothetical protein
MIKEAAVIDPMFAEEYSLWQQFRNFLGTYTKAINKIYSRSGHLFAGRYTRLPANLDGKLIDLIAFIHQNPEDHGIVSHFHSWPFSTYHAYLRRDRRSLLSRTLFSDDDLYTKIMDGHGEQVCLTRFMKSGR